MTVGLGINNNIYYIIYDNKNNEKEIMLLLNF